MQWLMLEIDENALKSPFWQENGLCSCQKCTENSWFATFETGCSTI